MSTSVLSSLSLDEQIFYSVVWQPMLTVGETWILAQMPFLNIPVVKQSFQALLNGLTNAVFGFLVQTVDVTAIQLLNPARQSAYASASEALKLIAQEQGQSSDAFKQAQASAIAAQISLTSFIGQ